MKTVVERIKSLLTYNEMKAVKCLQKEIDGRSECIVSVVGVCDQEKITRSIANHTLIFLEVAGLIEVRSLGAKGTYIKIIDEVALNAIVE